MKLIELGGKYGSIIGNYAQVDDDDFEWFNQWRWYCDKREYLFYARRTGQTTKNGKQIFWCILMHRMILGITDPNIISDHIDGNGLNNQRANLRMAIKQENSYNRKMYKNNKSKYKGVSQVIQNGILKWRAYCCINGKSTGSKLFKTEIEAALWYNNKAVELHGQFSKINIL